MEIEYKTACGIAVTIAETYICISNGYFKMMRHLSTGVRRFVWKWVYWCIWPLCYETWVAHDELSSHFQKCIAKILPYEWDFCSSERNKKTPRIRILGVFLLELVTRIELATCGLRYRCSTIEPHQHFSKHKYFNIFFLFCQYIIH